ncbi:CDP-glycerol glycerophosphotransferase family protein [Oscillospiraceae bacterium MB24-C1]|nr:CDP-glycerol glycerophosphotransferase family protein [Oscillospiraceae bacterium MB24-C1]
MRDQTMDIQRKVSLASYAVEAARQFAAEDGKPTLTEQKSIQNDDTMVTVVCITYNHEEYIAQALDSFLMQKTDFKFKVFVGEDCGPDSTADIVREYAAKYPDIIVPFIREENVGAQRNLIDMCQRATSPYIAFCEGDDYWTDEYKLQKQVDYMQTHHQYRACFCNAEIIADDQWYLNSHYAPDSKGRRLIPHSMPEINKDQREWTAASYISNGPAHTSTMLFRWNYDLPIPDTYYTRVFGDHPIMMMQLGLGKLSLLPDVVSAYRRSDVGIIMFKSKNEHFVKTRLNWILVLTDLLTFFEKHYGDYCKIQIENRIKLEATNYLKAVIARDDSEAVATLFTDHPEAAKIVLRSYISFYHDSRALTRAYSWEGYKLVVRNRYYRNLLRPIVWLFRKTEKVIKGLKWLKGKLRNIISLALYWKNTLVPKRADIWVFSGFNKKTYVDNTKYFYEYVLAHHPEITAYWLTMDQSIFDQLQSENKPVLMMRTRRCRSIVSRAAIAVTDHYRMSDYDALSGLNDNLKIVQLWHGVGLKSTKNLVKSTTVPGAEYSDDILPAQTDNAVQRLIKKMKYIRHAYFRELFEKWFMVICPGPLQIGQFAAPLNIKPEQCFVCGFPRNIFIHQTQRDTDVCRILYAPTYRWNATKEKEMVQYIIDAAVQIQETMQALNANLTIRLHPHTWRSYGERLARLAEAYDRIQIDTEKDVYQTLGRYSVLISDYSSIANDFVLLDRPIIYFNYDFEAYTKHDTQMDFDYDSVTPGIKAKTWEEVLSAIVTYVEDPQKDGTARREIRSMFYDMSVNDKDNSRRIVDEIKRRLALQER